MATAHGRSKAKSAARRTYYREQGRAPPMLEAGKPLIMVTCPRGREGQCVTECYELFAEYLADLADEAEASDDAAADDAPGTSFEASYERELAALKAATASDDKPLQSVMNRLDCVVIFRAAPAVDVVGLVLRLLRDIQQTKTLRTRYALRIHPLSHTCRAQFADLETMAKTALAPHFHAPSQAPRTFAIQFNSRNNTVLTRDEVIKRLAGLVGAPHKVKLEDPELTIIVEVFQHLVGISVVPDYNKLCRFNIVAIVDPALLHVQHKGGKRRREDTADDAAAAPPRSEEPSKAAAASVDVAEVAAASAPGSAAAHDL